MFLKTLNFLLQVSIPRHIVVEITPVLEVNQQGSFKIQTEAPQETGKLHLTETTI